MVVAIIAIIVALSFGGWSMAQEAARTKKTKAMIAKLDGIITAKYESYRTRRVRLPLRPGARRDAIARALLDARRDLMRMEMPDRWSDVTRGPEAVPTRPALHVLYEEAFNDAMTQSGSGSSAVETNASAECLYLIVSTGSADGRASFNESDIGDTDGDGLMEFLDGWGKPIRFLRWAPGFSELSDVQVDNYETHHDAFDTRGADPGAYHLVPLIYSAGTDQEYDIYHAPNHRYDGDPYADQQIGQGMDHDNNGAGWYDNIHNHYIEAR